MASLSDLYLGCLILTDARRDEWFAQIVRKTGNGVLDFKVESSAMAPGKDEALRRVCAHAGLKETPPRALHANGTPTGAVQGGVSAALLKCEVAMRDLAGLLGAFRRLSEAVEDLTGAVTNG